MSIGKGDILVDSIYLGEYNGHTYSEDTTGIVVTISQSQVLVYWFEPKSIWGRRIEYEWFDLNNERDVLQLNSMKESYDRWYSKPQDGEE